MPKQRQKSDCVIATIANLTGHSYRQVKTTCGTTRGGLERHEIEWLLGEFCEWKRYRLRKKQTANEWAASHPTARALLIVEGGDFLGDIVHAVAAVEGKVFDPSDGGDSNRRVLAVYLVTDEAEQCEPFKLAKPHIADWEK